MSINFACQTCKRSYVVNDSLAGRRVKCKGCGVSIQIPNPKLAPAHDGLDVFGLDDGPADEPVAPAPPPISGRSRPKPKAVGPASPERKELRTTGISILAFGLIAIILPRFGLVLTLRRVALDPQLQTRLGLVSVPIGAVILALSFVIAESSVRIVKRISVGVCIVAVAAVFVGEFVSPTKMDPRLAARFGPPVDAPPNGPGLPHMPEAPPGLGRHLDPNVPGAEPLKITLSNGKAMRPSGPFGSPAPGVVFSVDYTVEGGQRAVGERVAWVIRSNKGGAKNPMLLRLDASGTLEGEVITMTSADGPFETYLEAESLGPGGPSSRRLSNSVPMVWVENPAPSPAAAPPGGPGNLSAPGVMAPPGIPMPGPPGMPPGRRPMGPPGGFGPRGPGSF